MGGPSRPQLRSRSRPPRPSRRGSIGPVKTSTTGCSSRRSKQRSEPPRSHPDIVVNEHHQLAARALHARVARDVQAERAWMWLVASAETLHQLAHRAPRAGRRRSPAPRLLRRRPGGRSRRAQPPDRPDARGWGSRSMQGGSWTEQSRFDAHMVLFLHNRYRTTGGEERVVEDLMRLVREQLGEQVELLGRDSASLGRGRCGGRAAARGTGTRRSGARGTDCRRARSPCAQPQPNARLACAGGGAGGGSARRAAPAPVPAGVRDRRVLHARSGVHALPWAQHAAGGAPELPRQPSRGGSPMAHRWRCGSAVWPSRPTR